jgi:hypothetical protein
VVECAGLEIRYTVLPYRGFESLLLRQDTPPLTRTQVTLACSEKSPKLLIWQHFLPVHTAGLTRAASKGFLSL